MNIYKHIFLCGMMSLALGMTSCMNDIDDPATDTFLDEHSATLAEPNTTIQQLKKDYAAVMSNSNKFVLVEDDEIFEGIISANDGVDGLLYQNLVVRSIDGNADQSVTLGIKNPCLYPYYKVGQRVRINLKGLYIGNYSYVPKVGTPYYTSAGNLRLGPMLLEDAQTHIQLVGQPDASLPECQPIDLTSNTSLLRQVSNNGGAYLTVPLLVTLRGTFTEADGTALVAPEELADAGYSVNRNFKLQDGTIIVVRTGTQNDLALTVMPYDKETGKPREVTMTGILTYYSGWQFNCRLFSDFVVSE